MSETRRVAMVARDAAPSGAFVRLAEELMKRGMEPVMFVGGGKPLSAPVEKIIRESLGCNVVLLGMSSSKDLAKEELAVAEAAWQNGKPFGFYKDIIEGSTVRKWFNHDWLKNNAAFLFVRNDEEVKALGDVFRNTRLVASGNPLVEDSFFPQFSSAEVRSKLNIESDEKVIFCTGTKLIFENFYCFISVLESVHELSKYYSDEKFRVLFSMHPGDTHLQYAYDSNGHLVRKENLTDQDLMAGGIYRDLFAFAKVPAMLVTKQRMSSSDLLSGVDVVVNTGSTIAESAACSRLPVVDFFAGHLALARYEKMNLPDYPFNSSRIGTSVWAADSRALKNKLESLLFGNGLVGCLRSQQENLYPKPEERGQAVRIMADTLESLLS